MRTRRLGRSGLQVSTLSLGSWLTFGEAIDAAATNAIVERAFDLGIRFFDTADVYAHGHAEQVLGKALSPFRRHHVVVATKCFFPMSAEANDRGLSRKHLFESVEGLLRRLGTVYIDLHQCHRWDPDTPLDETLRAYEDLIRQGKVLYWGVSCWSAEQIAAACHGADAAGAFRPVSNQPPYSMLRRDIENEVLPAGRELGLSQVVFSPLAQGALTGKYSGGARPPGSRASNERLNRWMGRVLGDEVLARIDRLRPIAAELGLSLAQLALAWCLRLPEVASVIVGATRPAQLEENIVAADVDLPAEACAAIDALFPPGSDVPLPPGGATP